jgi:hypothetical protein
MPYQWVVAAARYRDVATGRFVARSVVLSELDTLITAGKDAATLLAQRAATGALTATDWQAQMQAQIKAAYIQQYTVGAGGRNAMTPADWGRVGQMLKEQYGYLAKFTQEIAAGELTEGQIAMRSRMYLNSAREAFNRADAGAHQKAGYTAVLWKLGVAEHCPDCIAFNAMSWQASDPWPYRKDGALCYPGNGRTVCLTNCQCGLSYRKGGTE